MYVGTYVRMYVGTYARTHARTHAQGDDGKGMNYCGVGNEELGGCAAHVVDLPERTYVTAGLIRFQSTLPLPPPRKFFAAAKILAARKFFDDAKISAARKFSKKKFGPPRSFSSKNRQNRSYPRDFSAV